jgi:hypothetical protein
MPLFSLPILLMVVAGPPALERPLEEETTGPQFRQVVRRSTDFLAKGGAAWMRKQQCASCHHIPVMVWALSEARQRGYRVDEKLLGEVTSWALAADNHARVFPDLPLDKKRTETDYLGPLLLALGVGAIEVGMPPYRPDPDVEPAVGSGLAKLMSQHDHDQQGPAQSQAGPEAQEPLYPTGPEGTLHSHVDTPFGVQTTTGGAVFPSAQPRRRGSAGPAGGLLARKPSPAR